MLVIEKEDLALWVEAIKKYDKANEWKLVSLGTSWIEFSYVKIYPQEREEINKWAMMADKKKPDWLGNIYFIPAKESCSQADYTWSPFDFFSSDLQKPILDEFRATLIEAAKKEAEIEKMRSNSQHLAYAFDKRNSSSLSKVEISLRKIDIMDETQLEELLVSQEYSQSPEAIKSKIAERYLRLQKKDQEAQWSGIENSERYY